MKSGFSSESPAVITQTGSLAPAAWKLQFTGILANPANGGAGSGRKQPDMNTPISAAAMDGAKGIRLRVPTSCTLTQPSFATPA